VRTADTPAEVDANHDCEAPSPSLCFETSRSVLRRGDGEIDTETDEQVNERLGVVSLARWHTMLLLYVLQETPPALADTLRAILQ
jgi:hypothetical protein